MSSPATEEKNPLSADPRITQLRRTLARVQVRLRLQEAAALAPTAVALALAATLLLAVAGRFRPTLDWPLLLAAGAGALVVALLIVGFYALLRPRDIMQTARRADRLLSLDERLSTALEDAQRPFPNPSPEQTALWDAQLEDALAAASRVSPQRDLPLKVEHRRLLPAAGVLLAIMIALFAPLPGLNPATPDGAAQAQVEKERKEIDELKKAVLSQPTPAADPAREALLKELDELLRDLSRGDLSREEALARLSQTEAELEKRLDPQDTAKREALDQLAKQLAESSNSDLNEASAALRQGNGKKAADALKKAGENSAAMSPEERKALAESLRQARDNTAALDPELARQLNDAAGALESDDPRAAEEGMRDLAQSVQERSQQAATQQQIRQSLAQIQQSKTNVAQAGQSTPMAANGTPLPAGTGVANGTPLSGTPLSGTAIAQLATAMAGTPVALGGSPVSGTPVALGSPVTGVPAMTGTPVLVQGTPGGTPVVAPGQGQGQGQGQIPGQGQGQGQGQQGQGSGSQGQQGAPSSGWGKGHSEPVYAPPSSVNAPGTQVAVQGQDNPGGEQSSSTTNTDANNTGPAQVPYEQVYGQYEQQAGNALDNDYIPQGYKDLVRDYFTSIYPEQP
jgi:hypothetical protein